MFFPLLSMVLSYNTTQELMCSHSINTRMSLLQPHPRGASCWTFFNQPDAPSAVTPHAWEI